MKSRVLLFLLLPVWLTAAFGQTATTDFNEIKIKRIKDGVYLAYRPEPLRPYVEGNVAILINEHDVVLVDAGGAPTTARQVIAEIKKLTAKPVRYIIYTHIHRDHRFGTQEYQKAYPGVELISHPADRAVIAGSGQQFVANTVQRLAAQRAAGEAEISRLQAENLPGNKQVIAHLKRYYERDLPAMPEEYRAIINVPATLTFEQRLTLHRGARTIEVLHLGKGDTPTDVIVYLPQDKLVCAGDMVVHPIPYGFSETPLAWLATLGKLAALDFDTLVPGHGEVQTGKAYLQKLMALL